MTDFLLWVYAKEFTAHEAAYLILGVDPSTDKTDSRSARHIKERMSEAYMGAFENLCFQCHLKPYLPKYLDAEAEQKQRMPKHERLLSVEMERLLKSWGEGDEVSLPAWLERGRTDILEQRFSRSELHRWITENQFLSVYRFEETESRGEQRMNTIWPWGNHHTELLGHLDAAARRFWVNYDPLDPTTAPTNEMVSDWLHTEHKVSRNMANAIASMLRADGLPTGPRIK